MDTINIREFCNGDEAALYEIFYSSVHQLACADYSCEQINAWAPPDTDLEAWYDRVKRNRPFVAMKDDEIVGFADVQPDGYIDQFFVSARWPKRGIGTLLMRHIRSVALEKGLAELTSHVSRTAEPFFLRFGFEVLERRMPVRRGVVLPNALMRKLLMAGSATDAGSTAL